MRSSVYISRLPDRSETKAITPPAPNGVGVGVTVGVGVKVFVGAGVGVIVGVSVLVGLGVKVAVDVGVKVLVTVPVDVGVDVKSPNGTSVTGSTVIVGTRVSVAGCVGMLGLGTVGTRASGSSAITVA